MSQRGSGGGGWGYGYVCRCENLGGIREMEWGGSVAAGDARYYVRIGVEAGVYVVGCAEGECPD